MEHTAANSSFGSCFNPPNLKAPSQIKGGVPLSPQSSLPTIGMSLASNDVNNQVQHAWGASPHEFESCDPAQTFKTKREALSELSDIFTSITDAVIKMPQYWSFRHKVDKVVVWDYNQFVDPKDEVWLSLIKRRAQAGDYSSRESFWLDVVQLHINCEAYNKFGMGLACTPSLVDVSDTLINHVCALLDGEGDTIEAAERCLHGPTTKRVRFE